MRTTEKDLPVVTIADIKSSQNPCCIGDDLLLVDAFPAVRLDYPARRACIVVGLCTHGSMRFTADTQAFEVKANDVFIISEGQMVCNDYMSSDIQGLAIIMSYNFFYEVVQGVHELSMLFLLSRNHPVFGIYPEEVELVKEYFHMIKARIDTPVHMFRRDVARMLMAALIYDMGNAQHRVLQTSERKLTRAEAIFTQFITLVEENFRRERRVSWYGKQLCITAKYLSETVKQVSHRTPNEWIDNDVVMELRVQLRNSTKSIKEIAHDMNFPNQSFLGKYFKEHVGMSPMNYRKK